MSREVRRVPLDFDWPLDKVWGGYKMPSELHGKPCPDCVHGGGDPTGYSLEAYAIAETFYPTGPGRYAELLAWYDKLGQAEVDMLVKKGRLRRLQRREPTADNPRDREWVTVPRTATEVNAANRRPSPRTAQSEHLEHDGINHMYLIEFRCKRLGIPTACTTCNGHCTVESYPGQRADAKAWKPTKPPKGNGWQLWETTSEGSPISPVFPTTDALAEWMAHPDRGDKRVPQEVAAKFIAEGWAPSGASTPTRGHMTGVEWVGTTETKG